MNLPTGKAIPSGALGTESPQRDLEAIIRSRTALIAVESNEEPQIVAMIRQIARRLQLKAFRWTITEGLQAFEPSDQPMQSVIKPPEIFNFARTDGQRSLFVLLDFHPFLEDTMLVRHLKDVALSYPKHFSTMVLVGCALKIPEELRPFTGQFHLPLPTLDELRAIVYEVAADWGAEHGRREVQTTSKALEALVRNLAGLTATDARRLVRKAIDDNGAITESDLPEVMRAKYELLGRDSPLSFEYETAQFSEIGGMSRLRQWLDVRKIFFCGRPTRAFGSATRGFAVGRAGLREEPCRQSGGGNFRGAVAAIGFRHSLQQILRRNGTQPTQSARDGRSHVALRFVDG